MTRHSREKRHRGPSRRIAIILEYDGTNYQGFQLQAQGNTIQGELEKAIEHFTGEHRRIRGASRTDSGTHSKGQVIDFLTNAPYKINTFVDALNDSLPPQIKAVQAYDVPLTFNSRRDASSRIYRYTVLNSPQPSPLLRNFTHWVRRPLEISAMRKGAQSFIGNHDFSQFTVKLPPEKSRVRHVTRWDVWYEDPLLFIEAEANSFLPHQIRKCNSLLLEVGLGKYTSTKISQVLNDTASENSYHIPLLPAKGLCLMKVCYPKVATRDGDK